MGKPFHRAFVNVNGGVSPVSKQNFDRCRTQAWGEVNIKLAKGHTAN